VATAARGIGVALLLLAPGIPGAWEVVPPQKYGLVELGNLSAGARIPPVSFDHWRHRARFTCRLCHVDVGFAMSAGQTGISASTNRSGYHCGACHNGKTLIGGKTVFASCSTSKDVDESPDCRRCHQRRDPAKLEKDYLALAEKLPRKGQGNGVDWEAAEAKGLLRPIDHVEGVSIRRAPLKMDKEISIESSGWMANVLFSHRKHSVWNGCEVCHPEIYPSTKSGTKKTTMIQISSGESCGVCHTKVAFPLGECERCHVKPVR
jgi:c(7)-type cytochrome triheme protein